jgi:hypothetical protein
MSGFSCEMIVISYEMAAVSYELIAVSFETSAFSYEMIDVSYETSAFSYEMIEVSYELTAVQHTNDSGFSIKTLPASQIASTPMTLPTIPTDSSHFPPFHPFHFSLLFFPFYILLTTALLALTFCSSVLYSFDPFK